MPEEIIDLPDEAATLALGATLAQRAGTGQVVFLEGGLGAGKTTLARGFIRAWTGDPLVEAPSPTFTLVQVYDSPHGPLWHMDLYRLKDPEEALELGVEEAFAEAVCLIEWPDRLGALAPVADWRVRLTSTGEGRTAHIARNGEAEGAGSVGDERPQ